MWITSNQRGSLHFRMAASVPIKAWLQHSKHYQTQSFYDNQKGDSHSKNPRLDREQAFCDFQHHWVQRALVLGIF